MVLSNSLLSAPSTFKLPVIITFSNYLRLLALPNIDIRKFLHYEAAKSIVALTTKTPFLINGYVIY